MSPNTFKFVSVGQALIRYDLRAYDSSDYLALLEILRGSDVAFTNLETIVSSEMQGWPTKSRGARPADPVVLDTLKWMGFDLLSLSNNHAFDFGELGILSTIENVKKCGLAFAGTGSNLEQAGAPCYLETAKGRVALIAMTTGGWGGGGGAHKPVLPDNAFATSKCGIPPARPGVNPQRIEEYHVVKKKDLQMLKHLSNSLGYEAMKNSAISVGWQQPEQEAFDFYGEKFVEGDDYEVRKILSEQDLKRNLNNIDQATVFADFVAVYIHQHHWDPDWQKTPKWLQDFAHKCVDAGANIFLCHGVPRLQGIEIYKKRPIFYGLGNFIFHLGPKTGHRQDATWQSVVAVSTFQGGELQSIRLHPIALGGEEALVTKDYKHRTVPLLVHGKYARSILECVAKLSKAFGTNIDIIDEEGEIQVK